MAEHEHDQMVEESRALVKKLEAIGWGLFHLDRDSFPCARWLGSGTSRRRCNRTRSAGGAEVFRPPRRTVRADDGNRLGCVGSLEVA